MSVGLLAVTAAPSSILQYLDVKISTEPSLVTGCLDVKLLVVFVAAFASADCFPPGAG